jgi:thioredoxin 2
MNVVCTSCYEINKIPQKESYKKVLCGKCKKSMLENNLINLNNDNFDEVVVNSDIPVIVDFWAPWCGPCLTMAPTFEYVSKNYTLKTLFTKVDTEKEQILGARFHIESIPTMIIFKNGVEVQRVSGALDENSMKSFVNSHL